MARIGDVIEGLQILQKYCKPEEHNICAEHDILYAGPDDSDVVTFEEFKRLQSLGWFVDQESGSWAKHT